MILQGQEVALRAIGTALAGLSVAFAGYMIAYGGGRIRVNGVEHLAIFAQPRGPSAMKAPVLPSMADAKWALDTATTGSIAPNARPFSGRGPAEIVAARADRAWVRVGGVIRTVFPGDDVPEVGRIAAIAARGEGWALIGAKGETLLTVPDRAGGAALLERKRIFE